MKAYVFPGQGAQFSGMGLDLCNQSDIAKELFDSANSILGFKITETMFNGSSEELKQTKVTQPAIFLHSVILAKILGDNFKPEMVAGHSLGEFSALVSTGVISFEDGLKLVSKRATAMQKACDIQKSTMAAVLGLPDDQVDEICNKVSNDDSYVSAANYNSIGQVVISGVKKAVDNAARLAKEAGAKRVVLLDVSAPFHSKLMKSAVDKMREVLDGINFLDFRIPMVTNFDAKTITDKDRIKTLLLDQLISPVLWHQSIHYLNSNLGVKSFMEVGPKNVLTGLIKRIVPDCQTLNFGEKADLEKI